MSEGLARRHRVVLVSCVLACASLGGCSGLRIHDESRAKLSTDAKTVYEAVKVGDVTVDERKNQAFLLEEEIKAVRSNVQLEVDFTMLSMAAGDTPMAATAEEAASRIRALIGEGTPLSLIQAGPPKMKSARESLRRGVKVFRHAGVAPPDCRKLPVSLALPDGLSQQTKERLTDLYTDYKAACREADPRTHFGAGDIGEAYVRWDDARGKHDDRLIQVADARAELRAASAAYDKRAEELAAQKVVGRQLTGALKDHAEKLADAVKALQRLDSGEEADEVLGALAELLTAAAGGQTDDGSASLHKATVVAKELPALAGELAQLQADRKLPVVSGLLLAMRHQTLLSQAAAQRAALAQERVDILQAHADALVAEAEAWVALSDALCSHAVLAAGRQHPGANCGKFAVAQPASGPWSCSLDSVPVANCALAQPWKTRLAAPGGAPIKRELAKAEMHYLHAVAAAAPPLEQRFREIDVRHREALLAKQTALQAWDNLISTPLVQIDNFHQTGLKPQEFADLVVKALGFTAIAIGAAQ
jgi:hypothetical protein